MAEMNQNNNGPSHILNASVHDVRYFTALLRGVYFNNRATVTLTSSGFVVNVEDARTLLGTAYIFADIFDEFDYNTENAAAAAQAAHPSQIDNPAFQDQMDGSTTYFEMPLNILIESLNVFGTAGSMNAHPSSGAPANATKTRRWKRAGEPPDEDEQRGGGGGGVDVEGGANARIDNYFKSQRSTGMRISYAGPGYPLCLLIAEDNSNPNSPSATCEITTFEPDSHVELPFDVDDTIMKIILKSSWLRDALSEIDPSCEKLTIIGHPPPPEGRAPRIDAPPRLRLKAVGSFGSTEMDYPNDREVLETCDCPELVVFSYKFAHISRALRALQNSTKTSLRINHEGLLSFQFLLPTSGQRPGGGAAEAFIEYRCLALDDSI